MKRSWYTFRDDFPARALTVLSATIGIATRRALERLTQPYLVSVTDEPPEGVGIACNTCSGPWHPATGHWHPERGEIWCGPCTKAAVIFIRDHSKRRWGGVRFYDHAHVPPEKPPPGWEP